ncbi:hypothetical protein G7054_g967 [Neopestalotiopsis clavispora]|nr:hypothetical protein G7054_g967 [Neopestalotiopsis clavispora]
MTPLGARIFLVILLATCVAAADDAEFAFNLLSDIAPILALFGDQFARQFTSESLTWVDHLIFAMVPLGIITAITSAIRVQGMQVAKAFIGRARENRALAEIELMSSTSGEVCELFNGSSIVRAMGKPKIAQFIIFPETYDILEAKYKELESNTTTTQDEDKSCGIHTLRSATCSDERADILPDAVTSHCPSGAQRALNGPPNLQLNLSSDHFDGKKLKKWHEIAMAAVTAVLLQISLIVIAAITAFYVGPNASSLLESRIYGFPCYVAGSVLLSLGTALCSFIVEHSTVEYSWESKQTVNDQSFDGYVISAGPKRRIVTSSRNDDMEGHRSDDHRPCTALPPSDRTNLNIHHPPSHSTNSNVENSDTSEGHITENSTALPPRDIKNLNVETRNTAKSDITENHSTRTQTFWEWLTVAAALSAGVGFTAQFMGLRGLAFPCSIAQLGAIFIMALIRAGIRRRLGRIPHFSPAYPGYELDFLATQIALDPDFRRFRKMEKKSKTQRREPTQDVFIRWMVRTPNRQQHTPFFPPEIAETKSKLSTARSDNPSSGNVPAPNDNKDASGSVTSQQVLLVRERLGDLTTWTSKSSSIALSLVQSIELVMERFFPRSSTSINSLMWQVKGTTMTSFETSQGQDDIFRIYIERKDRESEWRVDIARVDAILSLWMASIVATTSRDSEDVEESRVDSSISSKSAARKTAAETQSGSKPDWRRGKAGDNLTYSFYRIIGDTLQNTVLKRDISWWVDNLVVEQSELGEGRDAGSLVIGFHGIERKDTVSDLGIVSKASLPVILAQHLFTSFMWTVVQSTSLRKDCLSPKNDAIHQEVEIEGPTVFNLYDFDQTWPRLRLRSRVLTRLVRQMETYGLGNTDEILLCMIPAFSAMQLLPNQEIRKLLPRVGPGHDWVETATCYCKLLQAIQAYEIDQKKQSGTTVPNATADHRDRVNVTIVTATMDFLSMATEPYSQHETKPQSTLQMEIEAIVTILASNKFAAIMRELSPIYTRQGRQDVFKNVFRQFGHLEKDSQILKTFEQPKDLDKTIARNVLGFTEQHLQVFFHTSHNETSYSSISLAGKLKAEESAMTVPDIFGWTPWHYSCVSHPKLIEKLLELFELPAHRLFVIVDTIQRSPIHITSSRRTEYNLNLMFSHLSLDNKRSVMQASGIDGMTPLHLSCRNGSLAMLDLIAKWVNPTEILDKKDIWGRQALHIATIFGHDHIIIKLLNMGSNSNEPDNFGRSAIDYFPGGRHPHESLDVDSEENRSNSKDSRLSPKDSEVFLRFAPRDPAYKYRNGTTFFHRAVELIDTSVVHQLLDSKFDIEARDEEARTPLHYAILAGRRSMAEALIRGIPCKEGLVTASSSAKDFLDTTSLMFAARMNLENVAEALLCSKDPCLIDEENNDKETALHQARDLEMVEFLVKKGSDTLIKNSSGRTALHMAIERKDEHIAQYLLDLKPPDQVQDDPFDGSMDSLLVTACQSGCSEVVPKIIERWPSIVNTPDERFGQTPLSWACERGHMAIIKELLRNDNVDVNKPATGWRKLTPLHLAVRAQNSDMVHLILEDIRVELDPENDDGETPLKLAVENNCLEIAQQLVQHTRTTLVHKVRYLKEFVSSPSASDFRQLISDILRDMKDESLLHQFLVWLVCGGIPTREDPEEVTNDHLSAFMQPLARDLVREEWQQLYDPYNVVMLFRESAVRDTLIRDCIDSSGLDQDNWSYLDYINRSDHGSALMAAFTKFHKLDEKDEDRYKAPKSLNIAHDQESVEVFPCRSHEAGDCLAIQEVAFVQASSENTRLCMRSDHSIPPNRDFYYFEIEILGDSESKNLGIGFCGVGDAINKMPGWFEGSWGFHGDDGLMFVESGFVGYTPSSDFGEAAKFGRGHIVGAHLNMQTGHVFCTLNGNRLNMGDEVKQHSESLRFGKLYPCIGLDLTAEGVGLRFKVNFDGSASHPFKYKGLDATKSIEG